MLRYFPEGVNEFEARWIGWAGVNVPDEIGQKSLSKALAKKVHVYQINDFSFDFILKMPSLIPQSCLTT